MKKTLSVANIIALLATVLLPPQTAEAAPLSITARSAVLLDSKTSRLFYSKSPYIKRAPASTTKVLTALVTMEKLSLSKVVTIPNFVTSIEPSKAYLKPGERYYVRDLIRATLISSANDAAEVLAHHAGGSRAGFSKMMNRKASSLGCKGHNFIRASGLPAKGQKASAYCLALIMKAAHKHSFLEETNKKRSTSIRSLAGRKIYLKNHNKMLWRDEREVIGKTGWTRRAKHCFVGQIKVRGQKVLVAMMGSLSLWRDLKKLVDFQFGKTISTIKANRKLWARRETKDIQIALKHAGFNPGSVDGKFGPKTIRAIEGFQQAHGLKPDGIVGDVTMARLKAYRAEPGPEGKRVQQALHKAGFDPGVIDGILGPQSRRAIKSFQSANGLMADGIAGNQTWKKLQPYL